VWNKSFSETVEMCKILKASGPFYGPKRAEEIKKYRMVALYIRREEVPGVFFFFFAPAAPPHIHTPVVVVVALMLLLCATYSPVFFNTKKDPFFLPVRVCLSPSVVFK